MAQAFRLCLSQRRWRGGHQSETQYLTGGGFSQGLFHRYLYFSQGRLHRLRNLVQWGAEGLQLPVRWLWERPPLR